jgi:NAD(P)H dehydrogenase (quinone)
MTDTILITGAAGQLGRGIIRHLLEARNVAPASIIATTRTPEALADLAAQGVVVRKADFNDPASLAKAFKGAAKVLIVSTNEIDDKGTRLKQHQDAVAAAKAAGAARIYYTSMPEPEPGSPVIFANDHFGTEQAIKASGLPYTIFRNGWYHENLMMALPGAVERGVWATSAGSGAISYVARDDIAAAIAGGLLAEETGNVVYTLTGPKTYTVADIAALTTEVTGKPINVVQLSDEQLAEGLTSAGLPPHVAALIVSFDANTRAGRIGMITDAVEKLSGRRSAPLRSFIEANKAAIGGLR